MKIEKLYYATCRVSSNILNEYYKKNNITIEPQLDYYDYYTIVYKNEKGEFINVYSDNSWDKYLEILGIHNDNYPRYERKCLDISNTNKKNPLENNTDYIVEKYPMVEIKRNINPNIYGESERMFDYWIVDYIKFKNNERFEEEEIGEIDLSKRKYITLKDRKN